MPSTLARRRKKQAKLSAPSPLTADEDNGGLLPTDVLIEVLLRVPAKELCHLRLVCRSWRSLTSSPGFATAHASRHTLLVASVWNGAEVHLLDLMSSNIVVVVRRLHVPERVHDLLSTDDHGIGLICVSPDLETVVTVLRMVPDREAFRGSSPTVLSHVPSTGEYKALRINVYHTGWDGALFGQERVTQTCNIITLGGGGKARWRARPCPPVGGPSCLKDRVVVVVDGVAYFLMRRRSYYSYDDNTEWYSNVDIEPDTIFAFDLATEEWRPNTIRGPLSCSNSDSELMFSENTRESLQLCVSDGCLVMAHHRNWDCTMDLWFLEDMDDDIDKGMIWNKRYSIQCAPGCKGHYSTRPAYPLHVLEDGRIVMLGADKERVLGVYDPRTNMHAKLASVEEYGSVRMHLGSLLCSSSGHRQSC